MFARAGVTGRILRGRDGRSSSVVLHPFLARPKKKAKTKCYCYVPFVWQALVAILLGLLVLMAGTAMTTTGYYFKKAATNSTTNATTTLSPPTTTPVPAVHPGLVNHTELETLHNLAYAGPVLMGVGCFVIVVSCVHVCEMRDQKIKEFEERRKAEEAKRGGKSKKSKNKVYDLIIKQLKLKDNNKPSKQKISGKQEQHTDMEAGTSSVKIAKGKHKEILKGFLRRCSGLSVTSTKSEYSNISVALRRIPMDIFTVDLDGNKDTSLQPILVAHPKPLGTLTPLTTKYPSDPCLFKTGTSTSKRKPMPWLAQPPKPPDGEDLLVRKKPPQHDTADIVPMPSTPRKHSTLIDMDIAPNIKHKASSHQRSASTSLRTARENDDSPSNVIVHQASIHYDYKAEEPASAPPETSPHLPDNFPNETYAVNDRELETPRDTELSRQDTQLNASTELLVASSSECTDNGVVVNQVDDNDGDDDSLGLDDVMLSSFEPSESFQTPVSPITAPSAAKMADVENWEGDEVLHQWREQNGGLTKPPLYPNNMGRRATIANGDCLPFPPPRTAHRRQPKQYSAFKMPPSRSGYGASHQKLLHVRTDPKASELTVKVTSVPYSNNLLLSRPPGHHAPPGHPIPDIPRLYKANTSPDLVRHGSIGAKRKPICDLHNKPARAFKS